MFRYKDDYNTTPIPDGTGTISVTSTSGNLLINATGSHIYVVNGGTKTAFFRLGTDNTVAALVASDCPILAGERLGFNKADYTYIAAICAGTDTTTLYITAEG